MNEPWLYLKTQSKIDCQACMGIRQLVSNNIRIRGVYWNCGTDSQWLAWDVIRPNYLLSERQTCYHFARETQATERIINWPQFMLQWFIKFHRIHRIRLQKRKTKMNSAARFKTMLLSALQVEMDHFLLQSYRHGKVQETCWRPWIKIRVRHCSNRDMAKVR